MMFDGTTGCNPNRLSSAKFLCQPWRVVLAGGSFVLAISFLIAGALRAASSTILLNRPSSNSPTTTELTIISSESPHH
jgi:hypothetical protein